MNNKTKNINIFFFLTILSVAIVKGTGIPEKQKSWNQCSRQKALLMVTQVLVFEMGSGMNECDHCIYSTGYIYIKQQWQRPKREI